MRRVVFVLAPGLHLLDLAGPAQVFSTAAELGHPYELSYVADARDVVTAQGLALRADVHWPETDRDDLVFVPGWQVTGRGGPGRLGPGPLGAGRLGAGQLRRLVEHHRGGGTVASVCAGAYALGDAGLLDGRRCTTHHHLQDDLAHRHPRAVVVRDVLYVVDDRVVSSAGIASGIDLALHLVADRHGPGVAARIARAMVVYARRNGGERQTSVMLRHRAHLSDIVHRAQDLIDERFADPLTLQELAAAAGVSQRTLTRMFTAATGRTPLRYQQQLRCERAEYLIGGGETVEAAARAVGFGDARMLRRLRSRYAASATGTPPTGSG